MKVHSRECWAGRQRGLRTDAEDGAADRANAEWQEDTKCLMEHA